MHEFQIAAVRERLRESGGGHEVVHAVRERSAVFVPAGAENGFTGYEHLSLLVVFERRDAQ
jgi:hypothetical protein